MTDQSSAKYGLSFRDGGWVLIGAAVLFLAILTWALAPAVLRMVARPPGDGETLASYEFDLSNLRLPETASLQAAMLYRDMVPVLDAPTSILTTEEVVDRVSTREKYLVEDDTVIGIEIGGEARAYPISTLHVHELIHDELGGVPIVVTWHWPSASPVVFDRRIGGETKRFGVSGLVAGGNQVLYLRSTDGRVGGEPLFSQLLARSITGPEQSLTTIPCRFTSWPRWRESHPKTTVAGRDEDLKKRYKHGDPTAYYVSGGLIYDTPVPEGGPEAKSPVVLAESPDGRWTQITELDLSPEGDWGLVPAGRRQPPRLEPETWSEAHRKLNIRHALWHAAHALGLARPEK
ncbi:MAG: DUF3179 domain-containing protein [Planctomycetes bacterium]|nr:DUF3179 domain-containing protein [Planctomycetota bacterium]MCP4837871.1 DUF3179 domain-containing protein [Planctomycetota bacterium]